MKYKFKGTPGPWTIKKIFDGPILVKDRIDGQEWYYLDGWIMSGNKKIGAVNYSTAKSNLDKVDAIGEFEANAHLTSSALDLLEACIGIAKELHETDKRREPIIAAIHKALNIKL